MAHHVARAVRRRVTFPAAGFCSPADLLERAVEPVEDAIELDAHLIGQRPAGVVVGAGRRPAGIRDVVRMILRLEHVEHVRAERLRRLHDVRAGRIGLARDR